MRDIVFVAGLLTMLAFVFKRPQIGVLLWAWTALLIPNAYLWGFARTVPFNMIVALITLVAWPLSGQPVRLPFNRTVVLLIALGVLSTVSAAVTIGNPEIAWREWQVFIKIIIFALVVAALMNTRERLAALIFAVVLALGFHGLVEGLKFIATAGAHKMLGPGGQIRDNNHFALAVLCTLPLLFFLYQQIPRRELRIAIIGAAVVLVFAVVGTFSRGGLIGLAAMSTWALLKTGSKFRYIAFLIPVALSVLAFAPDRWFSRMDTIAEAHEDYSFAGRLIAWKQNTLVAIDNPVLGGGFQAVQNRTVWARYAFTRFHALDFIPTRDALPHYAHAAHSIYFQILGDLGFVGFALFAALCFTAWRNTVAVINKTRGRKDLEWASQLALSVQYTLVGYFVAGAALSMAYFELIYVLFAALASLRLLVEHELRKPATQSSTASHIS